MVGNRSFKPIIIQNYYQILEVPADADATTIKKSFRRLAFQYHPDKHPDNKLKHAHFLLIQEAYSTLLDVDLRKAYDTELWLEQKNMFHHSQVLQPQMMIKRLQRFAEMVKIKKQFYVLENDTTAFLLDALNDRYMAVFQTKASVEEREIYADYVIFLAQDLPKAFRDPIFDRLHTIFGDQINDMETKIYQIQNRKKSSDLYQKYLLWIPLLLGVFICLLMYLYARGR